MLATAPLPQVTDHLTATVCWFGEEPLTAGQRFRVKHTTRSTVGFVDHVHSRLEVNRLRLEDTDTLEANDIGVITISTADPLVVDPYGRQPHHGELRPRGRTHERDSRGRDGGRAQVREVAVA